MGSGGTTLGNFWVNFEGTLEQIMGNFGEILGSAETDFIIIVDTKSSNLHSQNGSKSSLWFIPWNTYFLYCF